jgi:MotA/TolQ/ExbB proton channel family
MMLRFALINLAGIALVAAAFAQGWLGGLFRPETWTATALIFLVFAYGLAVCGLKIWQTGVALDGVRAGALDPQSRAGRYLEYVDLDNTENRLVQVNLLRMRLSHKISIVRQVANALVFLGLIGTVIGFIIALSGVTPEAAGDANNVAAMVSKLIAGMSIALYTTLLGAVLNLWLTINYRILSTGTVNLLGAIVELGEVQDDVRRS